MASTPKLYFPNGNDFNDLNVYLEITMKALSTDTEGFSKLGSLMKNYTGNIVTSAWENAKGALSGKGDFKKALSDITGALNDAKKLGKNGKEIKPLEGHEIFKFLTYVPSDLSLSLQGDWQSTQLISTAKVIETAVAGIGGALGGVVGSALSNQYTLLKNQIESFNNVGLSPFEIKLFQPSFLDQTLNFEFNPNNSESSFAIIKALNILKQGVVPKSADGEFFEFPALFDIKVKFNASAQQDIDSAVVSNKGDKLLKLYTDFENLGMTTFSLVPISGNNSDLKAKYDGSFLGYKLSLSFTSTEKIFDREKTVQTRVKDILGWK